MSNQFRKILLDNKELVVIGNIFYADTELIIKNQENLKVLHNVNNISYVELNVENNDYKIVRGIVCKSRIHTYLCNIVAELKKEIAEDEQLKQVYLKMLEDVAKVIT